MACLRGMLKLAQSAALSAAQDNRIPHQLSATRTAIELVRRIRQLAPPRIPTEDEIEARTRPRAAEVVTELRRGILRLKRADLDTGICSRCRSALSPETRAAWDVEAKAALARGEG